MTYKRMFPADIRPDGVVRLPKSVRQALHLPRKAATVGFIIEGDRVVLTRTRIVPDTRFSDRELASLAKLSKRGAGRRTFHTADAALRHLWSL